MKEAVRYLDAAQLACDGFGIGADDDLHASVNGNPAANGQSVKRRRVKAFWVLKADGQTAAAQPDLADSGRLQR